MNAAAAALLLAVLAGCTGIDLQSVRRADGTTAAAADEAVYGTEVTGAVGLRPDRVARVVARGSA